VVESGEKIVFACPRCGHCHVWPFMSYILLVGSYLVVCLKNSFTVKASQNVLLFTNAAVRSICELLEINIRCMRQSVSLHLGGVGFIFEVGLIQYLPYYLL